MAGNAPALQAVVMGTCGRWSVPREGGQLDWITRA